MSIAWLLTNLVAAFLLPPLNGLVLTGVGWLMWAFRPRLARALVAFGLLLLVILALPIVGNAMMRTLEGDPLDQKALRQAQAIVVLGAGRYRDAPEYGGDTVSSPTLIRIRYGAKLHRQTGLPILVSGGKPDGGSISEAEAMRRALVEEFRVPVRWVEGDSNNTRENARLSAAILNDEGIRHVLLVTHADHMRRAERAFAEAGLSVTAAPTLFTRSAMTLLDFVPQGYGKARTALHEWIGILWYAVRG